MKKTIAFLGICISIWGCKDQSPEQIAPGQNKSTKMQNEEAFPGQTGELVDVTLNGNPAKVEKINGQFILEGDIILSPEKVQENARTTGAGMSLVSAKWPNSIVFYTISDSLPNKERVFDAIRNVEESTKLKFVQRTTQPNYIDFIPGTGCSSHMGMNGGRQVIILERACSTGNTIHEIGHAVGLFHEHMRNDRDKYIKINWQNMPDAYNIRYQFQKYVDINYDGFDYEGMDFMSIMMYTPYSFSINGLPTIERLNGQSYPYQRDALSQGDKNILAFMYPHDPVTNTTKMIKHKTITTSAKIGDVVTYEWDYSEGTYLHNFRGHVTVTGGRIIAAESGRIFTNTTLAFGQKTKFNVIWDHPAGKGHVHVDYTFSTLKYPAKQTGDVIVDKL